MRQNLHTKERDQTQNDTLRKPPFLKIQSTKNKNIRQTVIRRVIRADGRFKHNCFDLRLT